MSGRATPADDPLWHRYWDTIDGRRPGVHSPILWHAALRRRVWALLELSTRVAPGPLRDAFSSQGLARRAWRSGHPWGAEYLALDAFNAGDMGGYRHWLTRAARSGDPDAAAEARRFETRLPHAAARELGRHRPYRRWE